MTLEELKRVASKVDLHFAELPEADSELQRHKIINSLEKALANLGFPQAYVKQLSKQDEFPMVKSFIKKMLKPDVKKVLDKLRISCPDKAGVAVLRNLLETESKNCNFTLKQLQRLLLDEHFVRCETTKKLMTFAEMRMLNCTKSLLDDNYKEMLDNMVITEAIKAHLGMVPKDYDEMTVLMANNDQFKAFELEVAEMEENFFVSNMDKLIQDQLGKEQQILKDVYQLKMELRNIENPFLFIKKTIIPQECERHMVKDDPSLLIVPTESLQNYYELPLTFDAMDRPLLLWYLEHGFDLQVFNTDVMSDQDIRDTLLVAAIRPRFEIRQVVYTTDDIPSIVEMFQLNSSNEHDVIQDILERFSYCPILGAMLSSREAVWKLRWEQHSKGGDNARPRTYSDPTRSPSKKSTKPKKKPNKKNDPFKKPTKPAPRKKPQKKKTEDKDEEEGKPEETYTTVNEDYLNHLENYGKIPDAPMDVGTDTETDDVEMPVKRKRGRPKKVPKKEMPQEFIDKTMMEIRENGLRNLNNNIR